MALWIPWSPFRSQPFSDPQFTPSSRHTCEAFRRPLHIARTACAFARALTNRLGFRFFSTVFVVLISDVLRFFHHQFYLTLFRFDRHRLISHPPHHVKGHLRLAVLGQFLRVRRDPFFDLVPHRLLDPVKPVRRA
jgi:hypothetical protein